MMRKYLILFLSLSLFVLSACHSTSVETNAPAPETDTPQPSITAKITATPRPTGARPYTVQKVIPQEAQKEIHRNLQPWFRSSESKYHDDYAGDSYDRGSSILTIYVTSLDDIQKYCDATQYDEYLEFVVVEYNLNTLEEYRLIVQEAYNVHFDNIIAETDKRNNCIMVRSLEPDFEAVSSFDLEELGIAHLEDMLQFGCWYQYYTDP